MLGLASTAFIHLGVAPNPETGRSERDLPLARQSLDLLSLLREKTRGNLTPDEEQFFHKLLADLRLRYVEAEHARRAREGAGSALMARASGAAARPGPRLPRGVRAAALALFVSRPSR